MKSLSYSWVSKLKRSNWGSGQTFSPRNQKNRTGPPPQFLASSLLPPFHLSLRPTLQDPTTEKIHSHRSLRPAAVATIILEEETLAINYMCAFHLLFCGGEPSEDLGGDGEVG